MPAYPRPPADPPSAFGPAPCRPTVTPVPSGAVPVAVYVNDTVNARADTGRPNQAVPARPGSLGVSCSVSAAVKLAEPLVVQPVPSPPKPVIVTPRAVP